MSTTRKAAKKKTRKRPGVTTSGSSISKPGKTGSGDNAPLTQAQRKFLKGVAHSLKPVVAIGNKGLTAAVLDETMLALDHHELIKIKLPAGDKDMRLQALEKICADCAAKYVTLIGRTGVIFKPARESKISLPR